MSELARTAQDEARPQATAHPGEGQNNEEIHGTARTYMIYVSPITSLQRNQERDRSLMPGIVLRTWKDVNKNIEIYKQAFGGDCILLNNDPKDANMEFNKDLLKPYLKLSTAIGKPATLLLHPPFPP